MDLANSPVKNMLIDLGGVLYEIDIKSTLDKYQQMRPAGLPPVDFSKSGQHELFTLLDEGKIEIDEFAQGLKDAYQLSGSIEEIKIIWRDLLVGLLPGRIEAAQQLSKAYNLALLSNTGRYHFDWYKDECKPVFDCLDHLFLSYEMGVRKPGVEIFHMALNQMGWKAEETLFLDDSKVNIDAAQALGIHTWWIETPDVFHEVVKNSRGSLQ